MLTRLFSRIGRADAAPNGKINLPEQSTLIDVRNVVKIYETGAGKFLALKGVNMQVNTHEFVAVIGKSGSGKSTLVNMISGIDRPSTGEVFVDDTPIHRLNEGQLAVWRGKSLGVIFQFFQLLPSLTVVENVMLPMDFCNMYAPRERFDRAMSLLEHVGSAEHAHKLPSATSGGQQQRTFIARALAQNARLLLLDEPFNNLDAPSQRSIIELTKLLQSQGKTIIISTHELGNVIAGDVAETVILLNHNIIAIGSPAQVVRPDVLAQAYL